MIWPRYWRTCTLTTTSEEQKEQEGSKNDMSEITSRYGSLDPAKIPDPETMCAGACEGTGWVPVTADDDDAYYRQAWDAAEAAEPSNDGWHFVPCADCDGSGKMR